jgi:putative transposase
MNSGARTGAVFPDDDHRARFLELVAELPTRYGIVVHAYALMTNRYDLMLTSQRGNLSRAMRFLGAEFTRSVNAKQTRDGALFHGRYKNRCSTCTETPLRR